MAFISRIENEKNCIKEFEELSKNYSCTDLGLGYPNYLPPNFVTKALSDVLSANHVEDHQYTSPNGLPRFTAALSKTYSKLISRHLDQNSEILVTAGSTEALFCAIMSVVSPGDEVIIIEPYFSYFLTLVKLAGGIPKTLQLKISNTENPTSENWEFDEEELSGLISNKTKAIIVNTPHNPTGKVFSIEELTAIAEFCNKWDLICISDEVYERMVFKPKTHIRIASLPGMFERTITIGAAEKCFSVTGWQIGFTYGPPTLIKNMQILHQYAVYNASTPLQVAFAKLFEKEYSKTNQPDSYFESLEKDLREKRDFIVDCLRKNHFKPIVADGGMYVMADISDQASKTDLGNEEGEFVDQKFVKRLMKHHSLQLFPVTVFCTPENRKYYENYVRICFVKSKTTLDDAKEKLNKFEELEKNS
ncbi:kynurenine aminotransferase-like isoform X2 [Diabrotica virgifera virgifera]|uniref:kynurenine--oxoglutarate transaminase n=1 Tax=Diabrotica virgifera virgifera TaxID=50390 RepID=A0ABM5K448_DIAVI|nr:kynurenine aminotransferase-like isoform X2 [Diabrotica virgifera virgifera]